VTKNIDARIAAEISWARTPDRTARTRPAREAFLKRFEKEVDPDGTLSPQERLPAPHPRLQLPLHRNPIYPLICRSQRPVAVGCAPKSGGFRSWLARAIFRVPVYAQIASGRIQSGRKHPVPPRHWLAW
jgi:hypothetical protein